MVMTVVEYVVGMVVHVMSMLYTSDGARLSAQIDLVYCTMALLLGMAIA